MKRVVLTMIVLAVASVESLGESRAVRQPDRALSEALTSISRLRDFTAFDWISGRYERGTLTLEGFSRTTNLKRRAVEVARKARGVDEVRDEIVLLPSLGSDDDIRVRAYVAIYTTALERYSPHGTMTNAVRAEIQEVARLGLDATDVARGPHGIHIVVSGARLTLLGEVQNAGDRTQAEMRVRTTGGILSVTNQLRVAERK